MRKKLFCKKCSCGLNEQNWHNSLKKLNSKICKPCHNESVGLYKRSKYREYKKSIFNKLNNKCSCCSIDDDKLLSIDHINGGGSKEKSIHRGFKYIKYLDNLSLNSLKDKYQLLCYNCNYCKGFWGTCYHSDIKKDINNVSVENRQKKIARLKLKLETIIAYGEKCTKCAESNPLFLTLDHVHNNGYFDKDKGVSLYKKLKELGYPKNGLQLLCHNCNAFKEYQSLRADGALVRTNEPNIYKKNDYRLTKEQEINLKQKAEEIFNKLYSYNSNYVDPYVKEKIEILSKLGDKCTCCGFNNKKSLFITQIDWSVKKEHRGRKFFRKLAKLSKEELNKNYKILCCNCNYSLENHHICAHNIGKQAPIKLNVSNKHKRERIRLLKVKLEALKVYGGECSICKENSPFFLLLHNFGYAPLKESGCGTSYFTKLKKLNFPNNGIRLLCHNCMEDERVNVTSHPQSSSTNPQQINKDLTNEAKILFDKVFSS